MPGSSGPRVNDMDWPGRQSRTVPVTAFSFVVSLPENSDTAIANPSDVMSTRAALIVISVLQQRDDFFNRPDVIRYSSFHRGRHAERLMHAAEVVIHEVECHHRGVVLQLF